MENVRGTNPSEFKKGYSYPVESVSWNDCQDFINVLNLSCWYSDNSMNSTHPVGKKAANDFGLFDMRGNVREWCLDRSHDDYYGAPADGSSWESGGNPNMRIWRGGSYNDPETWCGATFRSASPPTFKDKNLGFRLVFIPNYNVKPNK